jgi:hypothetical protein
VLWRHHARIDERDDLRRTGQLRIQPAVLMADHDGRLGRDASILCAWHRGLVRFCEGVRREHPIGNGLDSAFLIPLPRTLISVSSSCAVLILSEVCFYFYQFKLQLILFCSQLSLCIQYLLTKLFPAVF